MKKKRRRTPLPAAAETDERPPRPTPSQGKEVASSRSATPPVKQGRPRVATRDLVTIGQVWRVVGRRDPRYGRQVKVTQVHRADRQVEAMLLDGAHERVRIAFVDLRKSLRLENPKQPSEQE